MCLKAPAIFSSEAKKRLQSLSAVRASPQPGPTPRSQVDWSKVHVFLVDERCVPADDPANNLTQLKVLFYSTHTVAHMHTRLSPAIAKCLRLGGL